MILSVLRDNSSNTDCLPFVREWRLCAELDLWLVSSEAAPAVNRMVLLSISIIRMPMQLQSAADNSQRPV